MIVYGNNLGIHDMGVSQKMGDTATKDSTSSAWMRSQKAVPPRYKRLLRTTCGEFTHSSTDYPHS